MGQRCFGEGEMRFLSMRSRTQPCDPLVNGGRRIGHRADNGNTFGQACFDRIRRDCGRYREHGLLSSHDRPNFAEQDVEVLRLDGDHDEGSAGDGLSVRERRVHPQLLP